MQPAAPFPGKEDEAAPGPEEVAAARPVIAPARPRRRGPEGARGARRKVDDPDRPIGAAVRPGIGRRRYGADEGDLAAVRRKDRLDRLAEARIEIAQALPVRVEDRDQAVILAILGEEQLGAVRRPGQAIDAALDLGDPPGLAAAGPEPDLAAAGEGEASAVGREGGGMALADRQRRAAVRGEQIDLLRRRERRGAGVGPPLEVREFLVAAANEGEAGAVIAEDEVGKLLPVIPIVAGKLARGLAARRHPDVAHAGLILDPGEARHIAGAGQAAGLRKGERLGERVALGGRRRRQRQADQHRPETEEGAQNHPRRLKQPGPARKRRTRRMPSRYGGANALNERCHIVPAEMFPRVPCHAGSSLVRPRRPARARPCFGLAGAGLAGAPAAARRGRAGGRPGRHALRPGGDDRGWARAGRDQPGRPLHPGLQHQDADHGRRLRQFARARPARRGGRCVGAAGPRRGAGARRDPVGPWRRTAVERARLPKRLPRRARRCGGGADASGAQRRRRRQPVPGPALEPGDELEQYRDPLRHRHLGAHHRRQRACVARVAGRGGAGADRRGAALLRDPEFRDDHRGGAGRAACRPDAEQPRPAHQRHHRRRRRTGDVASRHRRPGLFRRLALAHAARGAWRPGDRRGGRPPPAPRACRRSGAARRRPRRAPARAGGAGAAGAAAARRRSDPHQQGQPESPCRAVPAPGRPASPARARSRTGSR